MRCVRIRLSSFLRTFAESELHVAMWGTKWACNDLMHIWKLIRVGDASVSLHNPRSEPTLPEIFVVSKPLSLSLSLHSWGCGACVGVSNSPLQLRYLLTYLLQTKCWTDMSVTPFTSHLQSSVVLRRQRGSSANHRAEGSIFTPVQMLMCFCCFFFKFYFEF